MRIDLHCHSRYSPDAAVDPVLLVKRARVLGLDGVAITDHNAVVGGKKAYAYGRALDSFLVVRGVEVSAAEGHVLAYGVEDDVPRGLPTEETVERIEALGGVAVAAHPYRFWSGLGEEATTSASFAAYEVQNARTLRRGNERARRLAARAGRPGTGGSDAHFLRELGTAATVFPDRLETESAVLEALRRGAVRAEGRSRGAVATTVYVTKCVGEWMLRGMRRI
jgi:predicted metal-dependent phosphoesterase TrpH